MQPTPEEERQILELISRLEPRTAKIEIRRHEPNGEFLGQVGRWGLWFIWATVTVVAVLCLPEKWPYVRDTYGMPAVSALEQAMDSSRKAPQPDKRGRLPIDALASMSASTAVNTNANTVVTAWTTFPHA